MEWWLWLCLPFVFLAFCIHGLFPLIAFISFWAKEEDKKDS